MSLQECTTVADFANAIDEAGEKLVIVLFSAVWVLPCQTVRPLFQEVAEKTPDIVFLEVDVDKFEELACKYDVDGMPTFLFLREKENMGSVVGASIDKVGEKITELISNI